MHLDYTKVIILILWWRNFQLEYWRTFQLVSTFLNKELTDRHLEQLFSSGSTRLIKGFKGKKGCSFDAALTFDDSFNLKLSFPKPKGAKGK